MDCLVTKCEGFSQGGPRCNPDGQTGEEVPEEGLVYGRCFPWWVTSAYTPEGMVKWKRDRLAGRTIIIWCAFDVGLFD